MWGRDEGVYCVKSIALNKFVCACGGGGGGTKTLSKINGTFTPGETLTNSQSRLCVNSEISGGESLEETQFHSFILYDMQLYIDLIIY